MFNVAVHVVPKAAAPELRVQSSASEDRSVSVILENRGTRYVYLRDAIITLRTQTQEAPLDKRGLAVLADESVLEPGKKRRVLLPLPENISGNDIQVEVALRESYR